jgi:hypothetical protein
MIQNAAFRRKVIYLALIALLYIPLYVIGRPAVGKDPRKPDIVTEEGTDAGDSSFYSPGGRLAQLRTEYDLSPAEIGDIDPTSESMKLATLGMRGVAATILWSRRQADGQAPAQLHLRLGIPVTQSDVQHLGRTG